MSTFFSMKHKDGIPYWKAPIPRRFHFCRAQTVGKLGDQWIWRCACGALRSPKRFKFWINKNDRRKWLKGEL